MEQENTQNSATTLSQYRGLKPWPKGVSGNPGGRPKRKPVTEAYENVVNEAVATAIAQAMVKRARKGDVRAAIEITDRLEGKLAYDDSERTPAGIQVLVINEIVRPEAPSETYGVLAHPVDNVLNINGIQEAPNKQAGQSETKAK